jgi:hypothetical protein
LRTFSLVLHPSPPSELPTDDLPYVFLGKCGALNHLYRKTMISIVRELPIIMDPVHIFLVKDINSQTNTWLSGSPEYA